MNRHFPLIVYFPLLKLLLCSFNAILFVLLSFLHVRDRRSRRTQWGGDIYTAAVVACAVLLISDLANDFAIGLVRHKLAPFNLLEIVAGGLLPPLVVLLFYRDGKERFIRRWMWRTYMTALCTLSALWILGAVNVAVVGAYGGWPGWRTKELVHAGLMVSAALGGGLALSVSSGASGHRQRNQRRWLLSACGVWAVVFLFGRLLPHEVGSVFEQVVPLFFVCVITYYVERFTFFDVLIKKGAFVFASLLLLTLYFVLIAPSLLRLKFFTWVGTLTWALTLWPIMLLGPWGYRRLSAALDRLWLGRRFSPAQATKFFLAGLQGAVTEVELTQLAQQHLESIFASEARVSLAVSMESPADQLEELISAPIRLGNRVGGEIRIRQREHSVRFQSEDMALLASLADALAFLLENLRLREKRLEQEKRERELVLSANRSELKALRAQVNPHFLFNALNTIAGLIPRYPGRAEQTIEDLAEVFRYTLRRSEREWVRLGEELEAVRSYLHIEQARFGEGLQFELIADTTSQNARIPAMIIQTLVENAVKHGVSSLTTPGYVEVRAAVSESQLRIEVRDNGPGVQERHAGGSEHDESAFGLRNIRERLQGYFGDSARLGIGRDTIRDMTLVTVEMPVAARTKEAAAQ